MNQLTNKLHNQKQLYFRSSNQLKIWGLFLNKVNNPKWTSKEKKLIIQKLHTLFSPILYESEMSEYSISLMQLNEKKKGNYNKLKELNSSLK